MAYMLPNLIDTDLAVFQVRKIKVGSKIVCNVIIISKSYNNNQYLFPWNSSLNQVSIALSELSYCNSSFISPNLKILSIDRDKLTMTFKCIKNIECKFIPTFNILNGFNGLINQKKY